MQGARLARLICIHQRTVHVCQTEIRGEAAADHHAPEQLELGVRRVAAARAEARSAWRAVQNQRLVWKLEIVQGAWPRCTNQTAARARHAAVCSQLGTRDHALVFVAHILRHADNLCHRRTQSALQRAQHGQAVQGVHREVARQRKVRRLQADAAAGGLARRASQVRLLRCAAEARGRRSRRGQHRDTACSRAAHRPQPERQRRDLAQSGNSVRARFRRRGAANRRQSAPVKTSQPAQRAP